MVEFVLISVNNKVLTRAGILECKQSFDCLFTYSCYDDAVLYVFRRCQGRGYYSIIVYDTPYDTVLRYVRCTVLE